MWGVLTSNTQPTNLHNLSPSPSFLFRAISERVTRHVKIGRQKTMFWRFQQYGDEYLATIEAIFHFYREYCEIYETVDHVYDGRYDAFLYYL